MNYIKIKDRYVNLDWFRELKVEKQTDPFNNHEYTGKYVIMGNLEYNIEVFDDKESADNKLKEYLNKE